MSNSPGPSVCCANLLCHPWGGCPCLHDPGLLTCVPVTGKASVTPGDEHFISICVPLARPCHMPIPSCKEGTKEQFLLFHLSIAETPKINALKFGWFICYVFESMGHFWLHAVLPCSMVQPPPPAQVQEEETSTPMPPRRSNTQGREHRGLSSEPSHILGGSAPGQ